MRRFLLHNIGIKLFSLLLAVVLWLLFSNESETATFVSARVEYRGLAKDVEISSDIIESIYLEVRGKPGRLNMLDAAGPAVVLDVSGVHPPGEQTFHIDRHDAALPRGVRLVRAIPAQLTIRFEHTVTRSVPVAVRFTGGPDPGYRVANYEVEPESVTIVGPESRMSRVDSAMTDAINLAGVVGETVFHQNTSVADRQVRIQSPEKVTVKVLVQKK